MDSRVPFAHPASPEVTSYFFVADPVEATVLEQRFYRNGQCGDASLPT